MIRTYSELIKLDSFIERYRYLKLGTTRNQLEKAKLEKETALAEAKVKSIMQAESSEELYANAIKAMTIYSGNGEEEDYDD